MDKINYELIEELNSDYQILIQLIKTTGAIKEFNGTSQIIPNKKILINTLGIQESKSSNEIENIYTTNSDIFESMAIEEEIGNTKEIKNYNKAVVEASEYIKNRPITRSLLEQIQGILEPSKKGIRKNQVHIGNQSTGQVIHMPPSAEKLDELLEDLINFINIDFKNHKIDPLINTIVTHHQFETIHPFLDGNGRTGRILIIIQLLYYGYIDEPILYVSRYINNTKSEYYQKLQLIRDEKTFEYWKSFILYYLEAIEYISNQSNELVKEIENLIVKSKNELLKMKFKRNTDVRLIDLLFSHPYFSRVQYEEELSVSKATATRDIEILLENNLIQKVEKSNKTYYKNILLYNMLENINK